MNDEAVQVPAEHLHAPPRRMWPHVQRAAADLVVAASKGRFAHAGPDALPPPRICMKTKAPLCRIATRAVHTYLVMKHLAGAGGPYRGPDFISPEDFRALMDALADQAFLVSLREAELAVLAGEWDGVLREWHRQSVTAVRLGRATFRDTPDAGAWRGVKARGGGRARIAKEGTNIEAAWKTINPAWVPKEGLTFSGFQKLRTDTAAKGLMHAEASAALAHARGALLTRADALYDLCVQWYVMAAAGFPAHTAEGALIRTIPTNYDLKQLTPPAPEPPALRVLAGGADMAAEAA